MKHQLSFFLLLSSFTTVMSDNKPGYISKSACNYFTDTIPQVCVYITSAEIKTVQPFTTQLTNIFPDPNSFETYTGCYYQFYTADEKPQIAVRLIKWGSQQEAANEFKQQVQSHHDNTGVAPERLRGAADSTYFSYETEDSTKCDECHMVAILGVYSMYISFKGQYEKVPRAAKKLSALYILQLMYDRIPGLSPRRIRIFQ
jgi:hypothetical protein